MLSYSQEIQVLNTLWVLGVQVSDEVELANGIKLVPAEQMVDNRDKEMFLQLGRDIHIHNSYPKAALVSLS